jgi:hypothetical protein
LRVTGMVMEATGIKLPVGSACQVELADSHVVEAEVVGFSGDRVYLMPWPMSMACCLVRRYGQWPVPSTVLWAECGFGTGQRPGRAPGAGG